MPSNNSGGNRIPIRRLVQFVSLICANTCDDTSAGLPTKQSRKNGAAYDMQWVATPRREEEEGRHRLYLAWSQVSVAGGRNGPRAHLLFPASWPILTHFPSPFLVV